MSSAEPVSPFSSVVAKLQKRHEQLLDEDETFVDAVRCGEVDRAEPSAVFGRLGRVGRGMQRSLEADQLEERVRHVKVYLHRRGLEQVEFPPAKVGYVIALTERRVMLFDASGKTFLSDSPIRMYLDTLAVDGVLIFLFIEGREATAVTVWERDDHANAFVECYRERQRTGVIPAS